MATLNMNLTLPTVSVTLGPEWATEINAAFEVIDIHDHTSGKGLQIPTSGLNINADLSLNSFKAIDVYSLKLSDQSTTLTGSPNAASVYVTLGNLYYTNSSGVAVQITSGGSVVSVPAPSDSFASVDIVADTVVSPSAPYVILDVDTSVARLITLPLASSVSAGRLFMIKDADGTCNANNITVAASGSDFIDGSASVVMDSDFSSIMVHSDGVSNWYVI